MGVKLESNLEVLRAVIGRKRQGRGYTLHDLCKATKLSYATVQQIDVGENLEKKSLGMYMRLADFLEIPIFSNGTSEIVADGLLTKIDQEGATFNGKD